ncbi:LysR substrate-binding domain-containing protein [Lentzea sp. NPDC058450]|uniref:LysR family transcriptional regulator n=1 Tax=Lentzea sp. NPDC058450 TaxID=3346505 RepID=UPI00365D6634
MDLRSLRWFVAVADELDFATAAHRLKVTRTALLRRITHLEREIGFALFSRDHRRVQLTETAKTFLPAVVDLLGDADGLIRSLTRPQVLEVAYPPSVALGLPVAIVESFRREHPSTGVRTSTGSSDANARRVANGEVDVAFLRPPLTEQISTAVLATEAVSVALPAGHSLAERREITCADLLGEPLVAFRREDATGLWKSVVDGVYRTGGGPAVVRVEPDEAHMLAVVADGVGICLITETAAEVLRVPGVEIRPIADGPLVALALGWRRNDFNSSVAAFVAHAIAFSARRALPR